MTTRRVWLGSTGPFLYDDSVLYIDEDGVISPDNQQAIATDGQVVVQSPPSSPVHVVRKQDLDDAIGDISGLETRITNLEVRFTSGSFGANVVGFFNTLYPVTIYWTKSDRLVSFSLPDISGSSTMDVIEIAFIPDWLAPGVVTTRVPVMVNCAPFGFDWGVGVFRFEVGWKFSIRPLTKAAAFPFAGEAKTLYAQMISYIH